MAGLVVALLSGLVTRHTSYGRMQLRRLLPDLAIAGVLLVSIHGNNVDLLHLLFGSILAVDDMR